MHEPVADVGAWLKRVVDGYYRYHAVPGNLAVLSFSGIGFAFFGGHATSPEPAAASPLGTTCGRLFDRWIPRPVLFILIPALVRRPYPRWEPYAVIPQVRICAGGGPRWSSLPRHGFSGNRSGQNAAHRGAADLQAAGDLGFADASAMQFPDLCGCGGPRSCGRPRRCAVLPGVRQASAHPFPQNLPFELGEDGQQPGHRATGGRGQIQRLGQRDETHSEMLQFLKCRQQVRHRPAPAIQPPHQHDIDLPAARSVQQLFPQLVVAQRRNRPPSLAERWSSPAGRHTPAWRGSAWGWSAGRWWKRGRRGRRETFSAVSVRWPKTLGDFAF